jgi:hypothetical protein
MRVNWTIMAEGVTVDARGALTAVGLAQSVLSAPALPMMAKRAIVLLLSGTNDEFIPGQPVRFSFQIVAPSGEVLCEHKGSAPMAFSQFPEVPTGITISAEAPFTIKEYGRHLIKIATQPSGHPEMDAELEFFVMKPPGNSYPQPADTEPTGVGALPRPVDP